MIKIENTQVLGWEAAIRGMRMPMMSHHKSDSRFDLRCDDIECSDCSDCPARNDGMARCVDNLNNKYANTYIGPNDHDLMMRLAKGGSVHAKYRRMIAVYVDITAPIFWLKEMDTYKIATVRNSSSTMHKIHTIQFSPNDFSHEGCDEVDYAHEEFMRLIDTCERLRNDFNETKDKKYWRALIEILPENFNMKSTFMFNYEVLVGMYRERKGHKLVEWGDLCSWIESLPYSELITEEV